MSKIRSGVSLYFGKNKFWLLLIAGIFAMGVYMGVNAARDSDLTALDISGIYASDITASQIVTRSFYKNIQLVAWICIGAMSVIGLPVILYLIYTKGMAIGCTVYALFMLSGTQVWRIVLCCFPYMLFLVMSFLFTGQEGICFSIGVARKIFTKSGARYDLSSRTVPFAANIIFSVLCVLAAALCEIIIKVNI